MSSPITSPGRAREKVTPEVVAAVAAAVSAYLEGLPGEFALRAARPALSETPGGYPSLWSLAGRQRLMAARDLRS